MSLWSPKSGIRMEVHSDQVAAQVYTAIGFDGSVPRKASQGGPGKKYGKMSAIALEQQNLIDAVNQPSKHDMFLVEMWCWCACNEELRAIGIGTRVGHTQ